MAQNRVFSTHCCRWAKLHLSSGVITRFEPREQNLTEPGPLATIRGSLANNTKKLRNKLVHLDVDVYTKTQINQKTLWKTKKYNRNRLSKGPVFIFSLPRRQFTPLSVTPLPLSLFTAQYNNFRLSLDIIIILQWGIYQHTNIFGLIKKSYLYTISKSIWWSRLFIAFGPKKYVDQ